MPVRPVLLCEAKGTPSRGVIGPTMVPTSFHFAKCQLISPNDFSRKLCIILPSLQNTKTGKMLARRAQNSTLKRGLHFRTGCICMWPREQQTLYPQRQACPAFRNLSGTRSLVEEPQLPQSELLIKTSTLRFLDFTE